MQPTCVGVVELRACLVVRVRLMLERLTAGTFVPVKSEGTQPPAGRQRQSPFAKGHPRLAGGAAGERQLAAQHEVTARGVAGFIYFGRGIASADAASRFRSARISPYSAVRFHTRLDISVSCTAFKP